MDGVPAGLDLSEDDIARDLARRQAGHGRGDRMAVERDRARIAGGVRGGRTTGAPVALVIPNRDAENWRAVMSVAPWPDDGRPAAVTRPRPGHADLAGALKYGLTDLRDVLERSSARETAARVAAGAVARRLLARFGVQAGSWVEAIGPAAIGAPTPYQSLVEHGGRARPAATAFAELWAAAETSAVRCPDRDVTARMKEAIDRAAADGDSLGGVFCLAVAGLPPGLGSYAQWDRRLDARLAGAVMGVNAVKGVEIGLGFGCAVQPGSRVHDPIYPGLGRETNRAGGLEGGVTTGHPLLMRAAMKPIPTLRKPLASVDLATGERVAAHAERSDVCAVPAAAVVAEAAALLEVARAWLEKFGGDTVAEIERGYAAYRADLAERGYRP